MDAEKHNRITAAITINAVLLVFILVAVVIAQIINIFVLKRRKQDLLTQYYELQQELEKEEDTLERLQTDQEFYDTVIKLAQMGIRP